MGCHTWTYNRGRKVAETKKKRNFYIIFQRYMRDYIKIKIVIYFIGNIVEEYINLFLNFQKDY